MLCDAVSSIYLIYTGASPRPSPKERENEPLFMFDVSIIQFLFNPFRVVLFFFFTSVGFTHGYSD
jgi:hypothetical protein